MVLENEPFVRVSLHRVGEANVVQSMDYFTLDGPARFPAQPAKPGAHYVARSGTVTFAVGQSVTTVDIPLIDNGLVDGIKDFSLVLTNSSLGPISGPWVRIEDNEMGSALDPLFVPELFDETRNAFRRSTPLPMPDGRLLVPDPWWVTGRAEWKMLHSNGSPDIDFTTTFASTFRTSFSNAALWALQVLSDGRIIADAVESHGTNASSRLVRLLPTGALDRVFAISNFTGQAVAQPDEKILVVVETNNARILYRLNTDGSPDAGFTPSKCNGWFALQNDEKILIVLSNSLVRLNPDGRLDNTLSPPPSTNGINYFLPRRNGKVIISNGGSFTQLDGDGSIDSSFKFELLPSGYGVWSLLEVPDGRLFSGVIDSSGDVTTGVGAVFRWNADGSLDSEFARVRQPGAVFRCDPGGFGAPPWLALGGPGQIFMAGSFTKVDAFTRPGLARLFTNPPERDFRVLTPAEFSRSSGLARVRVLRTGPTTNAASVLFNTIDDTAKAGEDYLPQSGTLNFSPLEVSKEVMVPLLAKAGVDARLFFKLKLSNPSAGYTNIASTPIAILADLRIATNSLRPRADGSITITLHGTVPGRWYGLGSSIDLKNWQWVAGIQATGNTVVFDSFLQKTSPRFFRALGE